MMARGDRSGLEGQLEPEFKDQGFCPEPELEKLDSHVTLECVSVCVFLLYA